MKDQQELLDLLAQADPAGEADVKLEARMEQVKDLLMDGIKRWQSIKGSPAQSLGEILPRVNGDRLRLIYSRRRLRPSGSSLRKQVLADRLLSALPEPDALRSFLHLLPDEYWAFFQRAAEAGTLPDSRDAWEYAHFIYQYGYIYPFYQGDTFFYVVPDEIRAAFQQCNDKALQDELRLRSDLNRVACAAVNLYGALSLDDFALLAGRMMDPGHAESVSVHTVKEKLEGYLTNYGGYRIVRGYLAAADLLSSTPASDAQMDDLDDLLISRRGKPRYTPGKQAFLRYADPDYIEETPQVRALMEALRAMGLDRAKAEALADALHRKVAAECGMQEIVDTLEEQGVVLSSGFDQKILRLIMDLFNNTRLWRNFGYTPNELVRITGTGQPRGIRFGPGLVRLLQDDELSLSELEQSAGTSPLFNKEINASLLSEIARVKRLKAAEAGPAPAPIKADRNDPCPCGSGLKYKRCCGKKG
ncbi:MAG: YecA family protein [Christensenellales bacterium]